MKRSFRPSLGETSLASSSSHRVNFYCWTDTQEAVEVWCGSATRPWQSLPFTKSLSNGPLCATLQLETAQAEEIEYTYRINHGQDNFEWLGSAGANGKVLLSGNAASLTLELTDVIAELPSSVASKCFSSSVHALSASLPDGKPGQIQSFPLGQPQAALRGLVLENTSVTWQTPRLISHLGELASDRDTQLLVFPHVHDAQTLVAILPLSTNGCYSSLRGDWNDNPSTPLWLRCERGPSQETATGHCIVGWAKEWELHSLLERMVEAGAQTVAQANGTVFKPSTPKPVEPTALRLCTWNSLGKPFTLSQVITYAEDLVKSEMADSFDSLLLDDGWADTVMEDGKETLRSFGARPGWLDVKPAKTARELDSGYTSPNMSSSEAFNDSDALTSETVDDLGLGIDMLKQKFPFIKSIGIWLTLEGYWNSISPSSPLAQQYPLFSCTFHDHIKNETTHGHLPLFEHWPKFWTDYFTALKSCGVTFVKVDNQSFIDALTEGEEESKIKAYGHAVMTRAAIEMFGQMVHCMSQSGRFNTGEFGLGVDSGAEGAVVRQHDDFFPDVEDSHRFHFSFASHLGLLSKALAYTPDLDMFQSKHPYSLAHAALRTFSAAPLYLTDTIGEHDLSMVQQIVAQRKDGSMRVLQNRSAAKENKACRLSSTIFDNDLAVEDGPAMKMSYPVSGVGAVLGVWHCRAGDAVALDVLSRKDIASAMVKQKQGDYVLFSSQTSKITTLGAFDPEAEVQVASIASVAALPIKLQPKEVGLFSIVPLQSITTKEGEQVQVACIGLVDKLGALNAVKSLTVVPGSSMQSRTVTKIVKRPGVPKAKVPKSVKVPKVVEENSSGGRPTRRSPPAALYGAAGLNSSPSPVPSSPPFNTTTFFRSPFQALMNWCGAVVYFFTFRWMQKTVTHETDERRPLIEQDVVDEESVATEVKAEPETDVYAESEVEEEAEEVDEEVSETVQEEVKDGSQKLVVKIDFAGRLGFVVPTSSVDKFSFTVDGRSVQHASEEKGDMSLITVAIAGQGEGTEWTVEVCV